MKKTIFIFVLMFSTVSFAFYDEEPSTLATLTSRPEFSTLVDLVKKAGLVETIQSLEEITLFAPTNEAFSKVPQGTLNLLLGNPEILKSVLLRHVVVARLAPENIVGLRARRGIENRAQIAEIATANTSEVLQPGIYDASIGDKRAGQLTLAVSNAAGKALGPWALVTDRKKTSEGYIYKLDNVILLNGEAGH